MYIFFKCSRTSERKWALPQPVCAVAPYQFLSSRENYVSRIPLKVSSPE